MLISRSFCLLLLGFLSVVVLESGANARSITDRNGGGLKFGRSSVCKFAHDFDDAGITNGSIDQADHAGFTACFNGPNTTPPPNCARTITGTLRTTPPPTGTFALHGRPVDVLPDGKTIIYVRARYYDPVNGRWLQRDPKGNVDGPNLYESFRSNAVRNLDPMGTEVWAEARLVKTTFNGVPVWRADYTLNKDGVSLGFGGLLIPSAVESTQAGTEFFRFTNDPRQIRAIEAQIENLRQIIEAGQIADIRIASLEEGIKTSATIAVALPVAAVAAPIAGAAFGSSLAGTAAAGATTGAISFGTGGATGEALIGGNLKDIAITGGKDAALGAVTFGVLGGGAKLLAGGSAATGNAVRTRVLANIQESQAARTASRFPTGTAFRNPSTIRFSQSSIRPGFRNPAFGTIDDLAEGLRTGRIKPTDIQPIRLVQREGRLITIDNRRLQAFREARTDIPTRMATSDEIAQAVRQGKFSAGPLGNDTIKIRRGR